MCPEKCNESGPDSVTNALGALLGRSILLADDDLISRKLGVALLNRVGAKVAIAKNGQEALDFLDRADFDCVLMDMQMPIISGFDATRKIRADSRFAGLLIIALTGSAEDIQLCYAAGVDDVIVKPYLPERLYSKLKKWLSADIHEERSGVCSDAPVRSGADSFDRLMLEKMLGNDPEKIGKFADRFIETARLGIDEVEGALACCDMTRLAMLGHRGKSPARMVGANGYARLCQKLEDAGKDANLSRCRHIAMQMRDALDHVEFAFERLHAGYRGDVS